MIQIKTFVFNPFQENTYLVSDDSKQCIILDPGCYFEQEQDEIVNFINKNKLKPKYVIHSHGHIDHALGADFIKDKYQIKGIMHKDDMEVYRRIADFGLNIGLEINQPSEPELFVTENEKIEFGNTTFDVFHVPGHSQGSIALYNKQEKIIFSGDVLFKMGIGRTDLFGGDHATLLENIREKLLTLDGDTVVYPGHGETTTIKEEKNNNPLLNY